MTENKHLPQSLLYSHKILFIFHSLNYQNGGMNYERKNEHGSKIVVIECIKTYFFHWQEAFAI
jgi:hypothetical protein